ncbi:C2H2 zinc finger [Rhizoctonia solani]|uniref:C2H2 zinc finger n=1 Tax=Rhizoctonia solani TaxID=456999 RepID=A0A8H8P225_9AGAM|nr:C2H2 zinc finger [Rhizoctonia solani]QRW24301.1 C2H2 zinc finger [Rhizoctonia solani]
MGYADMSQSGQRYSQTMQYPQDSVDGGQYINQDVSLLWPPASADAMTYRRRYEPTSALPSEPRNPMPRHPSGEVPMASVHEAREFVPVPSQPFYESNAPVSRPTSGRSPNIGQSTSALALERPYVCDICQTRFARHHDCRRHRETHVVNASGEKPHHCVVCGKSFTRKDALKRHTNQKAVISMRLLLVHLRDLPARHLHHLHNKYPRHSIPSVTFLRCPAPAIAIDRRCDGAWL